MPDGLQLQRRRELQRHQSLASAAADTAEIRAGRHQESSTCLSGRVAVNITRTSERTGPRASHMSPTRSLSRLSMQARSSGCQLCRSIKATAIAWAYWPGRRSPGARPSNSSKWSSTYSSSRTASISGRVHRIAFVAETAARTDFGRVSRRQRRVALSTGGEAPLSMCGLEERPEDRRRLPAGFPRGDIGLLELVRGRHRTQFHVQCHC